MKVVGVTGLFAPTGNQRTGGPEMEALDENTESLLPSNERQHRA